MRWRLVDRVVEFTPWERIAGTKAVSFEEYSLLRAFGRKGDLPESLLLGACAELARWLATASSGFTHSALLRSVSDFRVDSCAGMGSVLALSADVRRRDGGTVEAGCEVTDGGRPVARGRLTMGLVAQPGLAEAEAARARWRELSGTT